MILNEIVSLANKDKVEIYFPKFFINNLDDYHDIESLANTISDIAHKKLNLLKLILRNLDMSLMIIIQVFYILIENQQQKRSKKKSILLPKN